MGIQERKEREKEARREEIIAAAEKIFFQKGLNASTMDDVAEAAELSKGTLYLYYRSKEDLYLAVTLRGLEIMYSLFEKATATDANPIQRLLDLEEAYYKFFLDHRQHYRMMYFFENPEFHIAISESMQEQCGIIDQKVWNLVSSVIRDARDAGLLHAGIDPLEAGIMFWSNANGFFRLIDRHQKYWTEAIGVNLEDTLKKSSALLLEAMMTDKGHELFPDLLPYHGKTRTNTTETQRT
jgi:TetR/AcrR family transcriptional regulator